MMPSGEIKQPQVLRLMHPSDEDLSVGTPTPLRFVQDDGL
jgi:hypothetical protein